MNASSLCYLLLIDQVRLLPALFGEVVIPEAVSRELQDEGAPSAARSWMSNPPEWLGIRSVVLGPDAQLDRLHSGEREAILLAEQLKADLVVLDEKSARKVAAARGLILTGLVGILDEAARRGLIELSEVVERLRQTTFRASPRLLKWLLGRHHGAR